MPLRKPGSGARLPPIGELELSLLEHLWEVGSAEVLGAHVAVGKRRKITANTVGSALERLYKKGLLRREKVSHAYRYSPVITRDAFAATRMLDAAGGSRMLSETGLLSAFVELVAEQDDESLNRLEALIAKKREARRET